MTADVRPPSRRASPTLSRRGLLALLAAGGCSLASGGCGRAGAAGGDGALVYGTTGYGVQMGDAGLNPRRNFSGWSTVRYGVGETLFRLSRDMRPEPWLASGLERVDGRTVRVRLREGVRFSNGRALDAEAARECLWLLVEESERAAADLRLESVEAEGLDLVLRTQDPCPALAHQLCDPCTAVVDVRDAGADGDLAVGTGPLRATSVDEARVALEANEGHWGGAPAVAHAEVRSVMDGDTLAMALQAGEVQAAYGLPYSSYALFDEGFRVSSCATTRTFFCQLNCASPLMRDPAVRGALARGIDREGFVGTLLEGRGEVATGPFPADLALGGGEAAAPAYDPEGARRILGDAGWADADGDGVLERDGERLELRWLTYPGRAELPLLAESAQETLGRIGFDVCVTCTAAHLDAVRGDGWDVYAQSMVLAPTGDPGHFFSSCCLEGSSANYGGYRSDEVEGLARRLRETFDDGRAALAREMAQAVVDDGAYLFVSRLVMGIVSARGVGGISAHPCDYYELGPGLAWEGSA